MSSIFWILAEFRKNEFSALLDLFTYSSRMLSRMMNVIRCLLCVTYKLYLVVVAPRPRLLPALQCSVHYVLAAAAEAALL